MSTTVLAARGVTLPTGFSLTLGSAGIAPGTVFSFTDANGVKSWWRATRVWVDGTAVTVEAEPGNGPPPP